MAMAQIKRSWEAVYAFVSRAQSLTSHLQTLVSNTANPALPSACCSQYEVSHVFTFNFLMHPLFRLTTRNHFNVYMRLYATFSGTSGNLVVELRGV